MRANGPPFDFTSPFVWVVDVLVRRCFSRTVSPMSRRAGEKKVRRCDTKSLMGNRLGKRSSMVSLFLLLIPLTRLTSHLLFFSASILLIKRLSLYLPIA